MLRISLIIIILLFVGLALGRYGYLTGCYSREVLVQKDISNPTFSPNGDRVGFVLLRTYYREPQGICTFPNGGIAKKESVNMEVYTIGRGDFVPNKVAAMPTRTDYKLNSYTADVVFWKENEIYFVLLEQNNGRTETHNYAINVKKNMKIREVDNLVIDSSRRVRLNQANPLEWVTYDPTLGIVSYLGGDYVKFTTDEKLGTIYHPELEEEKLNNVWVSAETIIKL